jgi:hypothetical protein
VSAQSPRASSEPPARPRRRWPWQLHPLLFGLLPVVSLYSFNIVEVGPNAVYRSALAAFAGAALLLALMRLLWRDWRPAALMTTLVLILFFAYGHVYYGLVPEATQGLLRRTGLMRDHRLLLVIALLILAFGVFVIWRTRLLWDFSSRLVSWMGLGAMLVPLVHIASAEWSLRRPWPEATPTIVGEASGEPPDVYYIILDGYGRADVLETIYGISGDEFVEGLQDLGFYVAPESHSNYGQTSLSLASSLNLDYLDFLTEEVGPTNPDRIPLARLIHFSRVRRFLEAQGYRTVAFASGYRVTELGGTDVFLRPPLGAVNGFETLLLETSAVVAGYDLVDALGGPRPFPGFEAHREIVLYALEELPEVAETEGPKFVFVHIVGPHPPFVFGANGERILHNYNYSFRDGDAFPGTREQYLEGYRDQVTYLSGRVLEVLRLIVERSATRPVILLQADHGPGSRLDWASPEESDLGERFSILNAYLLPGVEDPGLYPEITPVNSFRVVLNAYFGAQLELLPDRSYFAYWDRPYEFVEIEP